MTTRAAAGLDGFLTTVRGLLAGAEVIGVDETGLRVAGRLHRVGTAGRLTLAWSREKGG